MPECHKDVVSYQLSIIPGDEGKGFKPTGKLSLTFADGTCDWIDLMFSNGLDLDKVCISGGK